MVDTTGQTNYTIALKDTANAPYVFHNLVLGKTADGHFKRPYVMTYTMSEAFREEYDRTKSIANFEGEVTIQYINSSALNNKEGSANLSQQSSTSNTNDPCPDKTIQINKGGGDGGGGNNNDRDPPNLDDNTGQMCIFYWIDFHDTSGENTGVIEYTISATQSILYIDCFNIGSTASGTQPCDEQAEFAVIDPNNCKIIELEPGFFVNSCEDDGENILIDWLKTNADFNPCELLLVIQFPFEAYEIYKNKHIAERMTIQVIGYNGRNDCSDAFRHAFFNAINARDTNSAIADIFGKAHECGTPESLHQEQSMDIYNNSVGNKIGRHNKSASDEKIAALIYNSMKEGALKVFKNPIDSNSELISSKVC